MATAYYHPCYGLFFLFPARRCGRRPFLFYTGSCKTAGFFTMGAGFLLHALDRGPGERVAELGAGWDNTTETRLRAELETVYNSMSWRLTAPLRALKRRMNV